MPKYTKKAILAFILHLIYYIINYISTKFYRTTMKRLVGDLKTIIKFVRINIVLTVGDFYGIFF